MAGPGGKGRIAKRPTQAPPDPSIPEPFTPEFFAEVNKGPLERAYEERQRDPATWNKIPWGLVGLGALIGLAFAYVNIFAALAVGITVGGSWYISYFIGMMARWKPGVINYVGGASTGASQVVLGVAFVLPALFFLSDEANAAWGFTPMYSMDALPPLWALIGFFLVGGVFGLLFFQFYRRLWLVERPLQFPGGFESTMGLLAISQAERAKDREMARQSIFVVSVSALVAGFFVLLRDLAAFGPAGARRSFLDSAIGSRFMRSGYAPDIAEFRPLYNGLLFVDPFFLAIGWFVRTRVALILLLGSLVSFVLPFFDAGARVDPFSLLITWSAEARTLAAGAIVGAGSLALFRLRGTIGGAMRSIFSPDPQNRAVFMSRRLVVGLVVGGLLLATALLLIGGVPVGGVLLVVPLGALLIAVLGLIAVKVTGETSVQALSPMILVTLLLMLVVLQLVGFNGVALVVLALGTAAFFGTGLVMSTDVSLDTKVGLYVNNPPHRQAMVQMAGFVPGIVIGTLAVWFFAGNIAASAPAETSLTAPFGRVFAGLTVALTGGEFDWLLFSIAVGLGIMVELATGLGTAFGVGMALQFFAPVTIFVGALLRGLYERMAARRAVGEGQAMLWRVAAPAGAFVGASFAAALVFILHQFVL